MCIIVWTHGMLDWSFLASGHQTLKAMLSALARPAKRREGLGPAPRLIGGDGNGSPG